MHFKLSLFRIGLFAYLLPFTVVHAEIIIHGTRVIYPSNAREITLQVSNNGNKPALVQAWIDEGDAKSTPDQSQAPFMITPPISRVDGNKGQTLRISALPKSGGLSKTQETLYWLNILDIPPKPSAKNINDVPENFLQLAIRSRIKFFYRPTEIKEDSSVASTKLQWSIQGTQLRVKNPTPFHITLTTVNQDNAGKRVDLISQGLMLKPFSEDSITLKSSNTSKMVFTSINDYGGRVELPIKVQ